MKLASSHWTTVVKWSGANGKGEEDVKRVQTCDGAGEE